ncbi:MAG: hypothetical protein AB7O62_15190 [Pirellulales bacterium]
MNWKMACAMVICLAAAGDALGQNCRPGPRLIVPVVGGYSPWQKHPLKDKVWYSEYQVRAGSTVLRQYVVWYEEDPQHCYCYNPLTLTYWGRWNYTQLGLATFSQVPGPRRIAGAKPHELPFEGEELSPALPGTDRTMPAPPPTDDLPPV